MAEVRAEQTVSGRRLAELLRIQYDTLRFEWRQKVPPVNRDTAHPRYSHETITALLNVEARGFSSPPTAEDLLCGRLVLLKPEEAVALVPRMTQKKLKKRSRQGLVAAVKVPAFLRFSKTSVMALANVPETFTTAEVRHILGIRKWTTVNKMFVKPGLLQVIADPDALNYLVVLRESLVKLLREQLPEWIDPLDWIEDRQATDEPLVHKREAARLAGIDPSTVLELVANRRLQFIWAPSKTERMVSQESLIAYIEEFPLDDAAVAHVYGTTVKGAQYWRRDGLLRCAIHRHYDEGQVYRACLIGMLREHLSPGIKAGLWFAHRQSTDLPLMPLTEAAKVLGMSLDQLRAAAKSGAIGGVQSPGGRKWWFSEQRIVRLERRQRHAAGSE